MSEPITGTGLAGGALTGASVYGLLTGTDYGVVFGAFAGSVFYIATAADLSAPRRRPISLCPISLEFCAPGWSVLSYPT